MTWGSLNLPDTALVCPPPASVDHYVEPDRYRTQFSQETKLLLVCQEGLRSAAAAYKLEQAGYQNVASITSGLQSVKPGTFDLVGSTELQNAGKAGLITIQGKISAVLGTVLICAFPFITMFFPNEAEQLFQFAATS